MPNDLWLRLYHHSFHLQMIYDWGYHHSFHLQMIYDWGYITTHSIYKWSMIGAITTHSIYKWSMIEANTPCNLNKFTGNLFGNRVPCTFLYNGFSWTFSVNRAPNAPCYRRNPHWPFWVYSPWLYHHRHFIHKWSTWSWPRYPQFTMWCRGRNLKKILGDLQDELHWYSDGPADVEMILPHWPTNICFEHDHRPIIYQILMVLLIFCWSWTTGLLVISTPVMPPDIIRKSMFH